MIRSSSHSLKFCNTGKQQRVAALVDEYRRLLQVIIDDFWDNGNDEMGFHPSRNELNLQSLISNSKLKEYDTWLSARMRQACGKQAIMQLKAAVAKRRKQLYVLKKLQRQNEPVRHLQSKIDRQPLVKPTAHGAKLELDSRFVDIENNDEGFTFIRISSIGNREQIRIPIKETKVSNKWNRKGKRKPSIRLSKNKLHQMFEIEKVEKTGTEVLGADQGLANVLSLSNGVATTRCAHNHNLQTIQKKLSRKKKGSKAFARAQAHRKNYTNWSLNQLNFNDCKELRLEKVQNLRRGRRSSRYLSHWTYALIKDKLTQLAETEGFVLRQVPNEFRSQRCSSCGWVRKANRKGKTFKCSACGFTADADLNAASNLKLDLFQVPYWVRQKKINRHGFFWKPDGLFTDGQEPIVPAAQRTE